jgi:dihydrodipicolinate synthase/N-acetylneuraminate lyase
MVVRRLRGSVAAALTPMRDGGRAVDLASIADYAAFLAAGGIDGVLVCGTTGEVVLLNVEERRSVAEAFVSNVPAHLDVAVHAGAQTSRDTIALAAHALSVGAAAVAVIAPP